MISYDLLINKVNKLPDCPQVLLRTEFFNSAVLIPIIKLNDEIHFLFQKRSATVRQPGEICFPGGKFDPALDSTYEDTAIRETIEEIGIGREKIKMYKPLGLLLNPAAMAVEAFIGELRDFNKAELNIDSAEVEKVFLLPLSFFLNNKPEKYSVRIQVLSEVTDSDGNKNELLPIDKLGLPEFYKKPWRGTTQRVLYYKTEHGPLWGITAELIYQLITKLELHDNYLKEDL